MSVSTTTTEWFAAPYLDEEGQRNYKPLDRDILQLPVIVSLQGALELVNMSDEDARKGTYTQDNIPTIELDENPNYEAMTHEQKLNSLSVEVRILNEGVLALREATYYPTFFSAPIITGCSINNFYDYSIISIHYYILLRKHNNREGRVTRYRYFRDAPDRRRALNNFYKAIQLLIRGRDLSVIKNIETHEWKPEKVLVMLNPRSGSGKSMKVYDQLVSKMLRQAAMEAKLVVTSYKNHASEYALRERLDIYAAILLISGDGLYHEFLSGMMERPDRQEAGRVPVSIVPTGSNNTLAGSVLKSRGEHTKKKYAAANCMFAFIKGQRQACDVVQIRSSNLVFYSGLLMSTFL